MLSNSQKSLLKRAQSEAGLSDAEYREALESATGCRSSRDDRFSDRHLDVALAYFEAIHWRSVDAGALQPSCKLNAVFRRRGYWARKNTSQETSRDRFTHDNLNHSIADLEHELMALGYGKEYCAGIRENVIQNRNDPHAQHIYRSALQRTLAAKLKALESAKYPF